MPRRVKKLIAARSFSSNDLNARNARSGARLQIKEKKKEKENKKNG